MEDTAREPVAEAPQEAGAATIEAPPTESAPMQPEPTVVPAAQDEASVGHSGLEPAPPHMADEETPASESVWGVTIEAPVVAKPTSTSALEPARATSVTPPAEEVPSQSTAQSQAEPVVPPPANNKTLITVMVVALVTLVVSVFALLRR